MHRALHILSAVGALSAAVASSAHASAPRADAGHADALTAAYESAAPLQGGGKGQGGGQARGHQGGGGGQHARGHQGGSGGRQARPSHGGGGSKARGGGGGNGRSETRVASRGRGNSGGERALRSNRGTRTDRVERGSGRANRSADVAPRGRSARAAGPRDTERATWILNNVATRGRSRGLRADAVSVRSVDDRVRLLNRSGLVLLDMGADRYGEIGAWRLRRMGDWRPRGNAPAFCRSGEGHPVWGREWCLNKGFGLGSRQGTLWSRGIIDDVIFRRYDYDTRLDRGGLLGVLGDLVLGRLALQAVTLGYDQPLVGMWVAEPSSPRLLRVYSGPYPVAEFVDTDYDNRPEILYVVQPL
jgi:hypothetical protein